MAAISDFVNDATNPVTYAMNLARRRAGQPVPDRSLTASNVGGDISSAYDEGAQKGGVPGGLGLAAREALISPVSRMYEDVSNTVGPLVKGIRTGVGAFVSGDATPPGAPPAAVAAPKPAAAPVQAAAPAPAPDAGPSITSGVPMISAAANADLQRRAYAPTVYQAEPSSTPSLQRDNPAPSSADALALINNGTWSGMIQGHNLERRIDADRNAAIAAQAAGTAATNAQSQRISAQASQTQAQAAAGREAAQTTGIQQENSAKTTVAQLTAQLAATRDPNEARRIRDDLLTLHGRDPRENAFKIATFEDALDPSNPLAGTRKVPVMVDASGSVRYLQPPSSAASAAKAPPLEQWLAAAKGDSRNKGTSDADLKAYYNKTYGGGAQ